jgi:hypothetical protein
MRESPIELSHVELSVGDSVRIDDRILTVLDISGIDVTFRVESGDDFTDDDFEWDNLESDYVVCLGDEAKRFPPRSVAPSTLKELLIGCVQDRVGRATPSELGRFCEPSPYSLAQSATNP